MRANHELIEINPFEDYRGQLKKIITKSTLEPGQEIEEIYVLYSNKGTIRGNHYHKETIEYFTVLSGEALLMLGDIDLSEIEHIKIKAEDNVTVKVSPFTAHAIKNESEEPLIVLAVSLREYKTSDTDTFLINII